MSISIDPMALLILLNHFYSTHPGPPELSKGDFQLVEGAYDVLHAHLSAQTADFTLFSKPEGFRD